VIKITSNTLCINAATMPNLMPAVLSIDIGFASNKQRNNVHVAFCTGNMQCYSCHTSNEQSSSTATAATAAAAVMESVASVDSSEKCNVQINAQHVTCAFVVVCNIDTGTRVQLFSDLQQQRWWL
jgi:hypothetical protein